MARHCLRQGEEWSPSEFVNCGRAEETLKICNLDDVHRIGMSSTGENAGVAGVGVHV